MGNQQQISKEIPLRAVTGGYSDAAISDGALLHEISVILDLITDSLKMIKDIACPKIAIRFYNRSIVEELKIVKT